jgi:hypothetical protein
LVPVRLLEVRKKVFILKKFEFPKRLLAMVVAQCSNRGVSQDPQRSSVTSCSLKVQT